MLFNTHETEVVFTSAVCNKYGLNDLFSLYWYLP